MCREVEREDGTREDWMSESEWECSLCGWRGTEDSLRRHPSGPMGCPECFRAEGLHGTPRDTARKKLETGRIG